MFIELLLVQNKYSENTEKLVVFLRISATSILNEPVFLFEKKKKKLFISSAPRYKYTREEEVGFEHCEIRKVERYYTSLIDF